MKIKKKYINDYMNKCEIDNNEENDNKIEKYVLICY